uniref:Large envelope protein n=1 Tax=Hepatitis B virus TaxID=10407 RepID=A0A8F3CIN3_HBV|nr:MAG: S protein [Hepatitis B virus]
MFCIYWNYTIKAYYICESLLTFGLLWAHPIPGRLINNFNMGQSYGTDKTPDSAKKVLAPLAQAPGDWAMALGWWQLGGGGSSKGVSLTDPHTHGDLMNPGEAIPLGDGAIPPQFPPRRHPITKKRKRPRLSFTTPSPTQEALGPTLYRQPIPTVTIAPTSKPTTAPQQPLPSSTMGNITSGAAPGFLGALPVVFFLWTKIQETMQRLDWWWTSLSSPACLTGSNGQSLQLPISPHSPTDCPGHCPGYRWMCLRRFIIFLCILLLLGILSLAFLDSQGILCGGCKNGACNCTSSGGECLGCCSMEASPTPSPWAFAKLLWALVSHHFSWLSSLASYVTFFVANFKIFFVLLIWMMWSWGLSMSAIWQLLFILFTSYSFMSAYM